jgi:hypothetical protein
MAFIALTAEEFREEEDRVCQPCLRHRLWHAATIGAGGIT